MCVCVCVCANSDEGHYCIDGERFPCPPGRYGDERRLSNSSCSGACDAGYYCPLASTRRDQFPCGGTHLYCPSNSAVPTEVTPGYYTINGVDEATRWDQQICPIAHYCEAGVIIQCPPGRYGHTEGLTDSDCTSCVGVEGAGRRFGSLFWGFVFGPSHTQAPARAVPGFTAPQRR